MTPYYSHGGIVIYHGDCREILLLVKADVVVTDPPYGIGESYTQFIDTPESVGVLVASVWPLLVASAPLIVLTPGNARLALYPRPTWMLAWMVPQGTGVGPWGFVCWHAISVYGKDPYLAHRMGSRPDAFVSGETAEKNGHPCPKPIGVWRWVVNRVSLPSSLVLDPFMGSGTTLVAAKQLGRRAIGIEIEERYCEIAAKRLQQEVLPLAAPEPELTQGDMLEPTS